MLECLKQFLGDHILQTHNERLLQRFLFMRAQTIPNFLFILRVSRSVLPILTVPDTIVATKTVQINFKKGYVVFFLISS